MIVLLWVWTVILQIFGIEEKTFDHFTSYATKYLLSSIDDENLKLFYNQNITEKIKMRVKLILLGTNWPGHISPLKWLIWPTILILMKYDESFCFFPKKNLLGDIFVKD